jgi:hypothetical protein
LTLISQRGSSSCSCVSGICIQTVSYRLTNGRSGM